ncbi:MAG: cystathionine beta-lyase [Alphaproteobacteria bacterium]|nr:cystathionine beta-lyase [Alphaproteobacteria bacterium]
MKDDTLLVTAGRDPKANFGIVNPPVYHASTVLAHTLAEWEARAEARKHGERGVFYGRYGTPTIFALEDAVAAIEGGYRGLVFPSGLAAISASLLAFLKTGDHVLMVDSVYGPARRVSDTLLKRFGVETSYYDPLVGAGLKALLRPSTRIVYVESPGSLTFEVQDIPQLADIAHAHGAIVMMDNTWASPLYFKPFEHGVDVAIQAATKYIVGHSDAMLGTVTASKAAWPVLEQTTRDLGQTAGPDDVYLAQRGIRTLSVRLRRHWETGLMLAEWLRARPEVECVMHPALPQDSGHALWKRDFLGASGLFGATLKPYRKEALAALVDGLTLYGMGASWGGYESLLLLTKPNGMRSAKPWPYAGPTLRIHAGLEDAGDLIADLKAGFDRLTKAA